MKSKRIGEKRASLVDAMVKSFHRAVVRGHIRTDLDTVQLKFRVDEYQQVLDGLVALRDEGFGKKLGSVSGSNR